MTTQQSHLTTALVFERRYKKEGKEFLLLECQQALKKKYDLPPFSALW
jgi:hypothetical protein